MGRTRSMLRRPVLLVPLLLVVVGLVAGGLALFQPWKLWVDTTVQETAPAGLDAPAEGPIAAGTDRPGTASRSAPAGTPPGTPAATPAATTPAGPVVLARGDLISHEHATSGAVRLVRLADGSRLLRLDDLDTSNGPDLHVWLTDARVIPGPGGWHVFDDGAYLDLGKLKGNKGSQNYPVPADADLGRYVSVTIWCDRFNVSFGAAPLARVG